MEINYYFINWKDNAGKIHKWRHEKSFCDTVGIWLEAMSGIQMVNIYPIAEWSINWIADKKSSH